MLQRHSAKLIDYSQDFCESLTPVISDACMCVQIHLLSTSKIPRNSGDRSIRGIMFHAFRGECNPIDQKLITSLSTSQAIPRLVMMNPSPTEGLSMQTHPVRRDFGQDWLRFECAQVQLVTCYSYLLVFLY